MRFILFLLFTAIALPVSAGTVLKYEPEVVQVSGMITKGKHQHPNGKWFDFTLLKLEEPASIRGDEEKDSFNVDEKGITEIQVSSTDEALLKKVAGLSGKKATLTGTVFHAHTAWHVRQLVLLVTSVK